MPPTVARAGQKVGVGGTAHLHQPVLAARASRSGGVGGGLAQLFHLGQVVAQGIGGGAWRALLCMWRVLR